MTKINMGCGWRNFGSDWIHIDGGDYDHVDYKSIIHLKQFEDNTVDIIYASHVLQYFDRQQVLDILLEWRRILKPGGILRLAVPNFLEISKLVLNKKYPLDTFLGPLYGKMTMGHKTIYHKTVYDFQSIKTLLNKSLFKDVVVYDWRDTSHSHFDDHSQAYIPHMDKEKGQLISLNIECKK